MAADPSRERSSRDHLVSWAFELGPQFYRPEVDVAKALYATELRQLRNESVRARRLLGRLGFEGSESIFQELPTNEGYVRLAATVLPTPGAITPTHWRLSFNNYENDPDRVFKKRMRCRDFLVNLGAYSINGKEKSTFFDHRIEDGVTEYFPWEMPPFIVRNDDGQFDLVENPDYCPLLPELINKATPQETIVNLRQMYEAVNTDLERFAA